MRRRLVTDSVQEPRRVQDTGTKEDGGNGRGRLSTQCRQTSERCRDGLGPTAPRVTSHAPSEWSLTGFLTSFPSDGPGIPPRRRVCTTFLFSPHCPALSCIPGFGATGALWAKPRAPSSDHKEGIGSEIKSAGLVIATADHTQVYTVCQVLWHRVQ